MDRKQAKLVVFNLIKNKLKKLESTDDIQKLFDKETWRTNFIDWLYDNGVVLLAPPGIDFEEDAPKSKFMEEWARKAEITSPFYAEKLWELMWLLAKLIDKYKEDKK